MYYLMDGEAKDPYTKALEQKVALVNSNDEWKVGYMTWAIKLADERWEGREEGREEGSMLRLIKTVCKKIVKGKDVAAIANDLEEDEAVIQKIASIAAEYAPEYDAAKIYQAMR